MNEFCTCGAHLPADARFCHKCGKPQYDYPEPELEAVQQPSASETVQPAAQAPATLSSVTFRNALAVRTSMLVAFFVTVALSLPIPAVFQVIWQIIVLLAAGFVSVYVYNRRAGEPLTVRSGARLGWITGVFCFLIMMVMFTISVFLIASGDGLKRFFEEMVAARGTPEMVEQFNQVLSTPAGVAALLFGMLAVFFLIPTVLSTVGGALGAKVLEKE